MVTAHDEDELGVHRTTKPDCTAMFLNTHLGYDQAFINAATHEMGHKLGLFHTGRDDSFIGQATDSMPAMTTCVRWSESYGLRVRQDDRAALEFFDGGEMYDRSGNPGRFVTANLGFENSARDWAVSSGASLAINSSGHNGLRSAHLHSSAGQAELYQRVAFAPEEDVESHLLVATAWAKLHTSTDVGSVQLAVFERTVNYSDFPETANWLTGDCTADEYTLYKNVNSRVAVGPALQISFGSCVPKSSWTYCQAESGYTRGSASNLYDASDLQLVVRSNMKTSTFAWSGVDIDDAAILYYGHLAAPLA